MVEWKSRSVFKVKGDWDEKPSDKPFPASINPLLPLYTNTISTLLRARYKYNQLVWV